MSLAAILILSAATAVGDAPASDENLKGANMDVRDTLHVLVEYVNTSFVRRRRESLRDVRERWQRCRIDFDAKLDAIAAQLANQPRERDRLLKLVESHPSLSGSLVKIAMHRHTRRKIYEDFPELYQTTSGRSQRIGPPREEHCTEEYRHVWEYYVLVPKSGFPRHIWHNALRALAKIENPESLVVITAVAQAILHPEAAPNIDIRSLTEPLYAFGAFHSNEALKRMVEYLLKSEQTVENTHFRESLRKSFDAVITYQPPGEGEPPWLPVIEVYLGKDCPEKHRKLLEGFVADR